MKTTLTLVLTIIIGMMVKGQTTFNQNYNNQFEIGGNTQKLNHSDLDRLNDLLNKSSVLKTDYDKLKKAASYRQGDDKMKMTAAANKLYKKFEAVQIEISELSAKIAYQKFDLNKISILGLMKVDVKDEATMDNIDHALSLLKDAEIARTTAIDMREEAYAQTNSSAKLGSMGNAEEKEQIALDKQNEAIALLEKANLNALTAFASVK